VVAGQAVVKLVDPQSLWVKVRFDQGRSAGLAVGLPATITLRSNPAQPLAGRVARVEAISDAITEERLAQVAFDSPPAGLGIGELAEVTVTLAPSHAAVVVPNASIRQHGAQTGVWLAEGGALRFAPLRLGHSSLDGRVEVLGGLQPGDPVVLYSEKDLRPGTRIRVVDHIAGSQP
jgi:HlyD family secretion protein